ncbi:uncharacterized protein RHIMIDRAFT_97387 [Rhizopus microsporus ATCC 52813]|uniref:Uncharacterized protein n=1 Tax=Rhizopus microsporus ATCC 52813 TaxID=1340429 RepID=A0A2G4SFH4_RHIZD|nr:uncharacterized protein RHIMIDRAFT_97387 [Rhizopus microsporus ATCC 52813]PHZ07523.1 hypothetical protein RHIMIDRAFT_97387 [Rhizopus microsporus ATCC 52813]
MTCLFNDILIKLKLYRSECHSQTIKALKANDLIDMDEKDIRLGFVFTNLAGIEHVFFCERQTYKQSVEQGQEKAHSVTGLISCLTKNASSICALCHITSTS